MRVRQEEEEGHQADRPQQGVEELDRGKRDAPQSENSKCERKPGPHLSGGVELEKAISGKLRCFSRPCSKKTRETHCWGETGREKGRERSPLTEK